MTRIEFLRSSGRWLMLLLMLAAGGFLFASRRISFRNYCTSIPGCVSCGLKGVCREAVDTKAKSDEKE
jgi:hypothetical protein